MWDFDRFLQSFEDTDNKTIDQWGSTVEPRFKNYCIKRVPVELRVRQSFGEKAKTIEGRLVLLDFRTTSLRLFAEAKLESGAEISITMNTPTQIFITGRVIWCKEYATPSSVLASKRFVYRMEIEFDSALDEKANEIALFNQPVKRAA